jgi:GNAT superfamily N-acetyltransferase
MLDVQHTPTLPGGLRTRPLTSDDLDAVYAVQAAQELAEAGEVLIELADIVADWQSPGFDLESSSVGVLEGGRLVAYAEITQPDRCEVAVSPGHQGRGIGTWLASWVRTTARAAGSTVIGMPVREGSTADLLLAHLGYRIRWTSWVLRLPEGAGVEAGPVPDGYDVRAARDDEHRQVWQVVEDAFLEWSARDREPFEYFQSQVTLRPGFEPWQLRVATEPTGTVIGAAFVTVNGADAFVQRLAVRRDHRDRGLARALLADAFAEGRARGCSRFELSTDSRTGALGLYEKVGMEVTDTWVNRAVDL